MHPIVAIVILKHHDLFWIHQRQASKRVYPNLWGIGIGGKVDAGEAPQEAALRELQEESGITLKAENLQAIFEFDWESMETSYHGHVYLAELTSTELMPCTREFQDWRWASSNEIQEIKKSGHLCPDTEYFWTNRFSFPTSLG